MSYISNLSAAWKSRYEPDPREAPASAVAESLSTRESDIFRLIAEGLSNKQIARDLAIAPETVKTHVSRAQILGWAGIHRYHPVLRRRAGRVSTCLRRSHRSSRADCSRRRRSPAGSAGLRTNRSGDSFSPFLIFCRVLLDERVADISNDSPEARKTSLALNQMTGACSSSGGRKASASYDAAAG
jgi:DNA-binding CsgD family transcriptional regulator